MVECRRKEGTMHEIRIQIRPSWTDEEAIQRLHQIIDGSGRGPWRQDDGYQWLIGCSNDWMADFREEDGHRFLIVAYRYSKDRLERVRPWLEDVFGYA